MIKNNIKLRIVNSYITSSISIVFILLLFGVFALILFNVKSLSVYAKESIVISVLFKPNADEIKILEFQKKLDLELFCKETDFVSKERAAEELKQALGEDFVQILEYNPLPASINLKLNADYTNPDSLSVIEESLLNNEIVEDVFYYKSLVNQVDKNVKNIGILISAIGFLLFLVAITLINNTIRLEIYAQRFTIKTMQLVGATKMFILKPFALRSILHGAITSLIAIFILLLLILYFQANAYETLKINNIASVFLIVFFTGTFITFASTVFSVLRYTNRNTDELY